MATENILMDAVLKGGDRQELHERIRLHSMEAARIVKEDGMENDLMKRILSDPAFLLTGQDLEAILDPIRFVGRSPEQTEEYLQDIAAHVLKGNEDLLGMTAEIHV
jgi:adenylosuccinate lyase